MADLGYPFVTGIEGRWAVGFEVSAFTPARKFDGKWWVSRLEGMIRYLPSKQALDSAGDEHSAGHERSIRISGYLNRACAEQLVTGQKSKQAPSGSPRTLGGYGHLGAYECEIHATEIELLPAAP